MTKSTLELYMYMGSHGEIIKWLEEQGVTTWESARDKLSSIARGIIDSFNSTFIGSGDDYKDVSLAGTNSTVLKVKEYFKSKE